LPSTIPVPDEVVEFPKPKKTKQLLESRSEKSTKIAGTAKNMGMVWVPLIRKGGPMTLGVLEKALTKIGQTNL